jgi:hypothetical protein
LAARGTFIEGHTAYAPQYRAPGSLLGTSTPSPPKAIRREELLSQSRPWLS